MQLEDTLGVAIRGLQDAKGDSNCQIYFDGIEWGYIEDGEIYECGSLEQSLEAIDERILELNEEFIEEDF